MNRYPFLFLILLVWVRPRETDRDAVQLGVVEFHQCVLSGFVAVERNEGITDRLAPAIRAIRLQIDLLNGAHFAEELLEKILRHGWVDREVSGVELPRLIFCCHVWK